MTLSELRKALKVADVVFGVLPPAPASVLF